MKNKNINQMLQQAAHEAVQIANHKLSAKTHKILISRGVDVAALRKKLNMSRSQFSEVYGLKIRTVEKWEQEKNLMDTTALSYLAVIANAPDAARRALGN